MNILNVSKREIIHFYKETNSLDETERKVNVAKHILNKHHITVSQKIISQINPKLDKSFYNNYKKKLSELKKQKKSYSFFKRKYTNWLNSELKISYSTEINENSDEPGKSFNFIFSKYFLAIVLF